MLLAPEERNTTNDRYQNHRTLTYVEESEISEVNNNTKNYERFETLKLLKFHRTTKRPFGVITK